MHLVILHQPARTSCQCKTHFVFPLKLRPHLSEFCIGAGSRLDVVHDVNVDVTEDDAVSVARSSRHIVDWEDRNQQQRKMRRLVAWTGVKRQKNEKLLSLQRRHIFLPMFPKMMPFSVEATLTLALMLAKSWGARVSGDGFSTNLRSPSGGFRTWTQ